MHCAYTIFAALAFITTATASALPVAIVNAVNSSTLNATIAGTALNSTTAGAALDSTTAGTALDDATEGTDLDDITAGTALDNATASTALAEGSELAAKCVTYCSTLSGCVCTIRPKDCSAFYMTQPGDTCVSIATNFRNFTVTQFYKWNPSIGKTCFGLQAYVPVCINTPKYKFVPPVQPDYGTFRKPAQLPIPVMPYIVKSCQKYELIAPGRTIQSVQAENGITFANFQAWNGYAAIPWAAYWACVQAPANATSG
jgi:hypothetical protein